MFDNESLHREMWHYIAQRTREIKLKADKDSFLYHNYVLDPFHGVVLDPYNKCFACEEAHDRYIRDNRMHNECAYCPLVWGEDDKFEPYCMCYNSLYFKWRCAIDWQEAADLADQIAEMEWR